MTISTFMHNYYTSKNLKTVFGYANKSSNNVKKTIKIY